MGGGMFGPGGMGGKFYTPVNEMTISVPSGVNTKDWRAYKKEEMYASEREKAVEAAIDSMPMTPASGLSPSSTGGPSSGSDSTDSDLGAFGGNGTDTGADSGADTGADTDTGLGPDAGNSTGTDTGANADAGLGSAAGNSTGIDTGANADAGLGSAAGNSTGPDTGSNSDAGGTVNQDAPPPTKSEEQSGGGKIAVESMDETNTIESSEVVA